MPVRYGVLNLVDCDNKKITKPLPEPIRQGKYGDAQVVKMSFHVI